MAMEFGYIYGDKGVKAPIGVQYIWRLHSVASSEPGPGLPVHLVVAQVG